MRIVVSIAVTAMALGSVSPAMAADATLPLGSSVSSMRDVIANAPLLQAQMSDQQKRFQDRPVVVGDQFNGDVHVRHRLGSQMVEYYPVADSGFHVSGGMRLFNVTNFNREGDKLTNNLLWSPADRGFGRMRTGFRRKTPAMTVGYTQTVADKLALGLEAGTMFGRANANMPHEFGRTLGQTGAEMRMNPVAAFVVGMKF